ncbi:MAG: hypothetical protein WBD55_03755, partial [Dehalococcoidia bacterium]
MGGEAKLSIGICFLLTGLVVFALALASACGESSSQRTLKGWPLDEVRAFEHFPLYWVGEEYDGLPLTNVILTPAGNPANSYVTFIYGSCTPSGGNESCSLPLSIRVQPY